MARLFALIGNRSDLAGRVLASEAAVLRVRAAPGANLGWGYGFYQGGEVLISRRPIDDRSDLDVAKLVADVRTDALLGHVRAPTVGALRTENTHPFRYRQWLFAQTGTVTSFDGVRERLLGTVPEFLRSGIRGETDAEIVFHVYLSFLHDQGRPNDDVVEPQIVVEAVRQTVAVVDGMVAEVGAEPPAFNLMVTNGHAVVALHRNERMAIRTFAGRQDAEAVVGDDLNLRRRTPELDRMHFELIASDLGDMSGTSDRGTLPPRWNAVPDRAIVLLTRDKDPQIVKL